MGIKTIPIAGYARSGDVLFFVHYQPYTENADNIIVITAVKRKGWRR